MPAALTFKETIGQSDEIFTALLGTAANAGARFSDADVGKAVKLTATDRYALCADGDEIEGFVTSVDASTSGGYSWGGVCPEGRKYVVLSGAVSIGGYVISAAQTAVQTATAGAYTVVKAGTGNEKFKWRLISGAGTNGSVGVIERVGS